MDENRNDGRNGEVDGGAPPRMKKSGVVTPGPTHDAEPAGNLNSMDPNRTKQQESPEPPWLHVATRENTLLQILRPPASDTQGGGSRPEGIHELLPEETGEGINGSHVDPRAATSSDEGVVESIRLRSRLSRRETGTVLRNVTIRAVLEMDAEPDTLIETGTDCWILDLDSDSCGIAFAEATLAQLTPAPIASHVSHSGHGIHAFYVGPEAYELASLAALSAPPSYQVELLQTARHPKSVDPRRPEARCGEVRYSEQGQVFDVIREFLEPDPDSVLVEMSELGLEPGHRYDHCHCPIAPHADSNARDCVQVFDTHVICYRCRHLGIFAPGASRPGVCLFGGERVRRSRIIEMARGLVHYTHADYVIAHDYPNLSKRVRKSIYRLILRSLHGTDDPRVRMAFNPDLEVVRGSSHWLDLSFNTTVVDTRLLSGFPACYSVTRDKEGGKKAVPDRVKVSNFLHRTPRTYPPLIPYRGIQFRENTDGIPVEVDLKLRHPIKLLTHAERMSDGEALAMIECAFPNISIEYVRCILAAAICGAAGAGQPAMLAALGPSGSGKGETIRLCESFLGDPGHKVTLSDDIQNTLRQIAEAIASGGKLVTVDELGKYKSAPHRMIPLLQVGADVFDRPLFVGGVRGVPVTAGFFFPTITLPEELVRSQEFDRRIHQIRLYRRAKNWRQASGGDTKSWRDRNAEHALAANSIVTSVWEACRELEFDFIQVAGEFGLSSIGDESTGIDPDILRTLYRYARNEFGDRVQVTNSTSLKRGWCDLRAQPVQAILGDLAPRCGPGMDEDFAFLQKELSAADWSEVLGVEDPIHIEVKSHRSVAGFRFIVAGMKGQEKINEQLPALPDNLSVAGQVDSVKALPDPTTDSLPLVDDILRQGGLL